MHVLRAAHASLFSPSPVRNAATISFYTGGQGKNKPMPAPLSEAVGLRVTCHWTPILSLSCDEQGHLNFDRFAFTGSMVSKRDRQSWPDSSTDPERMLESLPQYPPHAAGKPLQSHFRCCPTASVCECASTLARSQLVEFMHPLAAV